MTKSKSTFFHFIRIVLIATFCSLPSVAVAEHCATIDVLTIFDRSAVNSLNTPVQFSGGKSLKVSSTESMAQFAVAQLNQVMNNSGVGHKVTFRNCGVMHLDYTAYAARVPHSNGRALSKDLNNLYAGKDGDQQLRGTLPYIQQQSPGSTAQAVTIAQAMARTGADICIMLTAYDVNPKTTFIQGLAQVNNYFVLTADDDRLSRYAVFNLMSVSQHARVFCHELCHLLGAGHSDRQFRAPGPQAETDAAGHYHKVGNRSYTTLMGTEADYDTDSPTLKEARFSAIQLNQLSHPGTTYIDNLEIPVGDMEKHNNTAVVLRHASPVSMYHRRGDEVVINDNFKDALPIPPLTAWEKKKKRLLYACAFNQLETFAQNEAKEQLKKEGKDFNDPVLVSKRTKTNLKSYWKNREDTAKRIAEENKTAEQFISKAIDSEQEKKNLYISCLIGTNAHATAEEDEPKNEDGAQRTVWFTITPPADGDLEVSVRKVGTAPEFKPILSLYQGTDIKSLQLLGKGLPNSNSPHFIGTPATAKVKAKETLYLSVDNVGKEGNQFNLLIKLCAMDSGAASGSESQTGGTLIPTAMLHPANSENNAQSTQKGLTLGATIAFMIGALLSTGKLLSLSFSQGSNIVQPRRHGSAPKRIKSPIRKDVRKIILKGTLADGQKVQHKIDLCFINTQHDYVIGRGKNCDLVIEDSTVSKQHAALKLLPDAQEFKLILVDIGSTNGTSVDGRDLKTHDSATLYDGSTITMGKSQFIIHAPNSRKKIFNMSQISKLLIWFATLVLTLALSIYSLIQLCTQAESSQSPEHSASADQTNHQNTGKTGDIPIYQMVNIDRPMIKKANRIDLGTLKVINEHRPNTPHNDGTIAIYEVELPTEALAWSRPGNEPSMGDIISTNVLEGVSYTFRVSSVDIQENSSKVIVLGQLISKHGDVTMIAHNGRLLLQIDDRSDSTPRVYNLLSASDNIKRDCYMLQEIDSSLTPQQSPDSLDSEDAPSSDE